jgi:peptidylprolyl isomerase
MLHKFHFLPLSACLLLASALASCKSSSEIASNTTPSPTTTPIVTATAAPAASTDELKTAPSGLQYQDIRVGSGQRPLMMQSVRIAYVGKLPDGHVFDRGADDFKLGKGEVIKGWDQGILGGNGIEPMRVGGKRKLIIPPALGYGNQPMGTIPPNSTLIFEIELLRVSGGGFGN